MESGKKKWKHEDFVCHTTTTFHGIVWQLMRDHDWSVEYMDELKSIILQEYYKGVQEAEWYKRAFGNKNNNDLPYGLF